MLGKSQDESAYKEPAEFDRRFKYAVIACAILEFIVIAFVVYYKVTR
jgi:large-conductance mechanosensitive channel